MKRLLLFLPVFFAVFLLNAQVNPYDSSAQVLPYWNQGEFQRYRVTLENYRINGDDTSFHRKIQFLTTVTVKSTSDDGYSMEWRYEVPNNASGMDAAMYRNRVVLVQTDPYGNFEEAVNWEDVRDNVQIALQNMPDAGKENEHGMQEITEHLLSRETVENDLIRDIRLFYAFFGQVYKFNDRVVRPTSVHNPFGGKPFDAQSETVLTDLNAKEQTAVIKRWKTADHEQVLDAVYAFLQETATDPDNDLPEREKMPPTNLEDRYGVKIHCKTGWMEYGSLVRERNWGHELVVEEITLEKE
jgi:hypothetical protein